MALWLSMIDLYDNQTLFLYIEGVIFYLFLFLLLQRVLY